MASISLTVERTSPGVAGVSVPTAIRGEDRLQARRNLVLARRGEPRGVVADCCGEFSGSASIVR
jgi:hypothetical protein